MYYNTDFFSLSTALLLEMHLTGVVYGQRIF